MGLYPLHNYCVSCTLDYLKTYLESKSRLPIAKFSGYHCMFYFLINCSILSFPPIKSKFPHLTFLKLEFLTRINHTVVLIIQGNLYLSKHTRFFDKVTHQLGLSVFAKRENFLLCQIQSVPYHIRLSPIFNHINTHIIQKNLASSAKKNSISLIKFFKMTHSS